MANFCALLSFGQGLASSSRDIETELLDANAQDRHDLLNELVLGIVDKAAQCTQPNLRVLLKYVIRTLQSAQNVYVKDPLKAVDEEWCIASIQCAMLTRGMLINLTQAPTSHSLPNDFGWGGVVWKRVLEMVSLVNKALPSELPVRPAPGPPPRDQLATEPEFSEKASTAEKPQLSPPSTAEFTEKPREKPVLSVDTQFHDPRPTFKFSQDTFPDPHTPTHTQRLLQYQTHNSVIPQSSSPVFSTPSPVTARTPVFKWLPGLQSALALRSSAPLPHVESVGGRLPLYRFLTSSFRRNS
ncbi:unnamed protein product [Rhizoctonia solani]|uniref:Uncharacterized protein n=1 Tax=Rhizoctonia solani TaxID=456999 RepID=A0A8H2WLS2_9AGAM|nr:unnamed protein product [Rhizoctonia solani]